MNRDIPLLTPRFPISGIAGVSHRDVAYQVVLWTPAQYSQRVCMAGVHKEVLVAYVHAVRPQPYLKDEIKMEYSV